jgi:capsular polysaccharide biosynthesis protein
VELRAYWSIILRRIWVIALVVIIVALYSGYQYYKIRKTPGALHAYQSSTTLLIGLQAPTKISGSYSDYVSVSDSLADEFTTGPTVTSSKFAQQVYNQVNADMPQIEQKFGLHPDLGDLANPGVAVGAIKGSVSAGRSHSLVTISTSWNTPAGAWAITHAAGEVVVAHINDYIDYVVTTDTTGTATPASIRPVVAAKVIISASDAATIAGSQASKPTLLLVLVLVALLIGIALAFLIEYLDDRIRKTDDVVQLLQLPIYGEVPHAPSPGNAKQRGTRTAA